MFLAAPEVLVGELVPVKPSTEPPHAGYAEVRAVYGVAACADPASADERVPTLEGALPATASVLASRLRKRIGKDPTALIDCRSSTPLDGPAPTYRLAAACELRRSVCWCLSGSGGTELCEALLQVSGLTAATTFISAIQAIRQPDTRVIEGAYLLGDAVVVTAVTADRPEHGASWQIRGFALAQLPATEVAQSRHIDALVAQACAQTGANAADIGWWVAQHVSAEFLDCVASALRIGHSGRVARPHDTLNFGCADVLVTLGLVFVAQRGLGALVLAGRFGSLAVVLLDD